MGDMTLRISHLDLDVRFSPHPAPDNLRYNRDTTDELPKDFGYPSSLPELVYY